MELTIVQSLLLALYYWVSKFGVIYSLSGIYAGPLTASLISGIILGDIPTAMKIGAAIQPMFWPLLAQAAPWFGMKPPQRFSDVPSR